MRAAWFGHPAFREAFRDGRDRVLDKRRGNIVADQLEEVVEGMPRDARGEQCVPGQQQAAVHRLQLVGDIGEQLECQFCIQKGIVYLHSCQRGFLILLDEMMVGILGVGQRAQVERVDSGQVEQLQVRRVPGEELKIMLDDVVSYETCGSVGEFVECGKRSAQSAALSTPGEGGRSVGAYRSDRSDVLAALKVERQQGGKAMRRQTVPHLVVVAPALDCHFPFSPVSRAGESARQIVAERVAASIAEDIPGPGTGPVEASAPRPAGLYLPLGTASLRRR